MNKPSWQPPQVESNLGEQIAFEDRSKKLDSRWLKDVKDNEKDELRRRLNANRDLWERLEAMLVSLYRSSRASHAAQDNPNWANAIAYGEGYRAAIEDVYRLIPKGPKE